MQKIITLRTDKQNVLYNITSDVVTLIKLSKVKTGIASVYDKGATAAIMIGVTQRSARQLQYYPSNGNKIFFLLPIL